jgi:hypothetical protein
MIETSDLPLIDHSLEDSYSVCPHGLTLITVFAVAMASVMGLLGFIFGNGGWALIGALYFFGGILGVLVSILILLTRDA